MNKYLLSTAWKDWVHYFILFVGIAGTGMIHFFNSKNQFNFVNTYEFGDGKNKVHLSLIPSAFHDGTTDILTIEARESVDNPKLQVSILSL